MVVSLFLLSFGSVCGRRVYPGLVALQGIKLDTFFIWFGQVVMVHGMEQNYLLLAVILLLWG